MAYVIEAAAEIRRRRRAIDNYSLHKLLFFAQGFHLAWTGQPLFEERIEAWTDGPVVADLWRAEHYLQEVQEQQPGMPGDPAAIEYVFERYGHLSAAELIALTHIDGSPWDVIWHTPNGPEGHEEIPRDLMRDWFAQDEQLQVLRTEVEETAQGWQQLVQGDQVPGLGEVLERMLQGERILETRP